MTWTHPAIAVLLCGYPLFIGRRLAPLVDQAADEQTTAEMRVTGRQLFHEERVDALAAAVFGPIVTLVDLVAIGFLLVAFAAVGGQDLHRRRLLHVVVAALLVVALLVAQLFHLETFRNVTTILEDRA